MTMRSTRPTFDGRLLPNPHEPAFDQGLQFDLETLLRRRQVLRLLGYGSVATMLAACGGTSSTSRDASGSTIRATTGSSATTSSATTLGATDPTSATPPPTDLDVIPEETAGPYPGDGSNGPDVLSESGVVRSDITSSFGGATGSADGIPLAITFQIVDADRQTPFAGAAVYAWHCDREGRYSLYSAGVTDQNYLRGVQACDAQGRATFTSIFPGCYAGRWPHVHFEVYPSLDLATDVANKIATSQIALPADVCDDVYRNADGYEASLANFGRVSLASDNVFGDDGAALQLGTVTGAIGDGLEVTLVAAVRSGR